MTEAKRLIRKLKAIPIAVIVKAYPEEESWLTSCPHCGKEFRVTLEFDTDACEYQVTTEPVS